jgi:hypothetical protein
VVRGLVRSGAWYVVGAWAGTVLVLATAACGRNKPMADRVEMPAMDTATVMDAARRDSMLDTMPGGEMVRGNDSAAVRLLRRKM